jgi:hypothetical protein
MKYLTGQFVSEAIAYLDPELNDDPEFNRTRKRAQGPGIVTKILFGIIYLSFALDAAALLFVYIYCRA